MEAFEAWIKKVPKTWKVVKNYIPKIDFKYRSDTGEMIHFVAKRSLTENQIRRIMWIFYKAKDIRKGLIKDLWSKCKDWLYLLVSHQLKHIRPEQIREWTGFQSVRGEVWNADFNTIYFKKQLKYPVIRHLDNDTIFKEYPGRWRCLCEVEFKDPCYVYNDELKITFLIGSHCMGRFKDGKTKTICARCKTYYSNMRCDKGGKLKGICKHCKEQARHDHKQFEDDKKRKQEEELRKAKELQRQLEEKRKQLMRFKYRRNCGSCGKLFGSDFMKSYLCYSCYKKRMKPRPAFREENI